MGSSFGLSVKWNCGSRNQIHEKLNAASLTSGSFNLDKFGQDLLLFRNTIHSGGQSPAQRVFQRPVQDCLPACHHFFPAQWQKDADVLERRARRAKDMRTEHFNRRAHSFSLATVFRRRSSPPPRRCAREKMPSLLYESTSDLMLIVI